jgi:predicted secreted protein
MANEIINGTDLFVFMNDVLVAHATSHTLSIKMGTRKTSNKDTGVYETNAAGRFDVTASCDGLVVYEAGYADLINAMKLRAAVKLDFGQQAAGVDTLDTSVWYASGNFIITSFDMNASDGANATYSVSFEHADSFDFTPHATLNAEIVGYDPASAAVATAGLAVHAWGGIEPYTYAWTYTAGGSAPTVAGKCVACDVKAAVSPGTTYTCVITDSTPVTPLTKTITKTLIAVGA